MTPIKNEDKKHKSGFSNDYLLTYVLPGVIILAMLLLAAIIACVLHKRKYSGKMELGKINKLIDFFFVDKTNNQMFVFL